MIDTGGGERIIDLTDTTQTQTQVDRPCRTTVVTEVMTVDGTLIAVVVATTAVDISIAINREIAVMGMIGMTVWRTIP